MCKIDKKVKSPGFHKTQKILKCTLESRAGAYTHAAAPLLSNPEAAQQLLESQLLLVPAEEDDTSHHIAFCAFKCCSSDYESTVS